MERVVKLNELLDIPAFYGVNNENLLCIANAFPDVNLIARGENIKIVGKEEQIEKVEKVIAQCQDFCMKNNALHEGHIVQIIKGEDVYANEPQNVILYGVNGKAIRARSHNQQKLVESYLHNDLLFAIGPAGSGKTYVAIALAMRALKNKEVKKIILSRPAVEAGEKLGFLPGDMKEKVDPYLQPLYDALQDMVPSSKLNDYIDKGIIQIAPLAYMRGRTLADAVVILDEAQNTTVPQIKMFLTRLGINGKMIVTGDLTKIDLPHSQVSGLKDAINRLSDIKGIATIYFEEQDIVRHPLIGKIVNAYNKNNEENQK